MGLIPDCCVSWETLSSFCLQDMVRFEQFATHQDNNHLPDTTARTLDAAMGLLGLHQSIQEELYEEVMEVMPTEDDFVSNSLRA